MKLLRESLSPIAPAAVAAVAGVVLSVAFVLVALDHASGPAASFAVALLCLLAAAAVGPFLFGDEGPGRGAIRSAAFGICAAIACGTVAILREGPVGASLMVGLFAGLYALALGAVAAATRLRLVVAVAGVLALATLFFWDDHFLRRATDRNASASVAYHLNAAAASAHTLDFDWVHAKRLYTNNQTAERMIGVEQTGIGPMSLRLVLLAALGVAVSLPLRRRR